MQVTIDRQVLKEFQYLVDLHRKHGAANPFDNVEGLVAYERYRAQYGPPSDK